MSRLSRARRQVMNALQRDEATRAGSSGAARS
jgi:hypothetical protein